MVKGCWNCKNVTKGAGQEPCNDCLVDEWWQWDEYIEFGRLNGLTPTLESCTWKVFEEVGELFQLLGKGKGLSGEQTDHDHAEWVYKTISEALDGAQSLCTLIHVLAKENNVDIQGEVFRHEEKLRKKGYLV